MAQTREVAISFEAPVSQDPTSNAPDDIFKIGEVVAETYEIRGVLGAGGMGQVFDALDLLLNRRVAIKAHWPTLRQFSLRKEAQALAQIRHPSMVGVYCIGKHSEVEFLVMEHVPGITLESHLAQRKKVGDSLTPREALDILVAVADGLAAVHRAGIAHRDVKPANILLAPGDRVVLTDFGLVTPEFDTKQKLVAGTPAYMAPEAFSNEVAPGASNLLDVYAFGVLAFELFAGEQPFVGETTLQVMYKHVSAEVPDLTKKAPVPKKLAELVVQLLTKDPAERPSSMEAVAGQLRAIRAALERPATDAQASVLIVDDTPDIAKLMGMYVKMASPNADVTLASGARQALDFMRKKAPDVLVLDLMMPEMNGVELFMYLRGARLCEDVTVVAVSAGASEADLQLLHELGVAYFVPKGPELRRRLVAILKGVLGTGPKQAPDARPSSPSGASQD